MSFSLERKVPHEGIAHLGRYRGTGLVSNAQKAHFNTQTVQEAGEGELLLLLDCDMMATGSLLSLQKMDFDLAVTERMPGAPYPVNTGFLAYRVSPQVRAWQQAWLDITLKMLSDRPFHRPWHSRWGGIHQAAFGWLLENPPCQLNILHLPCSEWNSTDDTWELFDENTKLVHLMAALRAAAVGHLSIISPKVRLLAEKWKAYERAAASEVGPA